ncbi:hypothetical protein WDU94_005330 [Cyamophila willieti]
MRCPGCTVGGGLTLHPSVMPEDVERNENFEAQWNHGLNHVRVSCGTQEVELRTDMLQQHAAFIGGTNAATCPLCHKFFLGGEALVEHMKLHHKDPPSGVTSK